MAQTKTVVVRTKKSSGQTKTLWCKQRLTQWKRLAVMGIPIVGIKIYVDVDEIMLLLGFTASGSFNDEGLPSHYQYSGNSIQQRE